MQHKIMNEKLKNMKNTYRVILFGLLAMIFSILSGCRDNGFEPVAVNYRLTAEDIEVSEAYVRVTATGSHAWGTVALTRNGKTILQMQARDRFSVDTVIHDQYLYPKHTYTYKAYYRYNGQPVDSSSPLVVTTLDTTSHSFSFNTYEIGDYASSLSDVAIINDTCVIAVGEIYRGDSLYNMARWNGHDWQYFQVPTATYGGPVRPLPLVAVFVFSESDLWTFSNAGAYSHWDGVHWTTEYVTEQSGGGEDYGERVPPTYILEGQTVLSRFSMEALGICYKAEPRWLFRIFMAQRTRSRARWKFWRLPPIRIRVMTERF
jgi:archaellum component FlaF (FlaF/FlaG flagellin family)